MNDKQIVIIGANGQLGSALRGKYSGARAVDADELDITSMEAVSAFDWNEVTTIINAAAYTNVDNAETPIGRATAWQVNASGPRNLAAIASKHAMTLVHVSTDYVFDGQESTHTDDEPFSPLGVYGQTKAAGDIAVSLTPNHYIVRTSWVIGNGKNFVRSIMGLADKDIEPAVVSDQYGRLTFTDELVRAISHLLQTVPAYGTYNVSNGGDIVSWADIARQVYSLLGKDSLTVSDTTAADYFAGKVSAPRPVHSGLDLTKLMATGFIPVDWRVGLQSYINEEKTA